MSTTRLIPDKDAQHAFLQAAADFAQLKHKGQKDDSGKDYFEAHIMQVWRIIFQATDDFELQAAAFLHDTLEDTNTNYAELVENFGQRVARIVFEVTKTGPDTWSNLQSKDAIMLKFADRLSNLSRMHVWPQDRQDKYLAKSKFWRS